MTEANIKGMVDTVDAKEIVGWVASTPDSGPIRVSLLIDDVEVAATWAASAPAEPVEPDAKVFRFGLSDIWKYVPRIDALSVRAGGVKLATQEPTSEAARLANGTQSLESLTAKLGEGYLFNQTGRLTLSMNLDHAWHEKLFGLYDRVSAAVKSLTGYDIFICYGALLGLVREGKFIGHDRDFDCAYISRHTTGKAAATELKQLALDLIDLGFEVKCKKSCFDVSDKQSEGVYVDLFHLYFQEDGTLGFPFAIAGTDKFHRNDLEGYEMADLHGHQVRVPKPAERFVEHVYGASWRTPNPGFSWRRDRTDRARDGILTAAMVNEVYWANFYAHASYDRGSTFCEWITAQKTLPKFVVDIGCGDGRDSLAFGKAGRRVLAFDRSEVAVDHGQRKAQGAGLAETVEFMAVDVAKAGVLRKALRRVRKLARRKPVLFYTRFFLHSITEAAQEILMSTVSEMSQPGDYFAAEFRTDRDEAKKKVHGDHYRRYQNASAFAQSLSADYGYTVLIKQEGNGFSPYKDEDPELCRIIARFDGGSTADDEDDESEV